MDPVWQKVSLAKKLVSSNLCEGAGLQNTLPWLVKHSAARKRRSALGQRAARKFKDSNLGLSRATIEMTELQRWRAQIVIEADTPVVRQAHVLHRLGACAHPPCASMCASGESWERFPMDRHMLVWYWTCPCERSKLRVIARQDSKLGVQLRLVQNSEFVAVPDMPASQARSLNDRKQP